MHYLYPEKRTIRYLREPICISREHKFVDIYTEEFVFIGNPRRSSSSCIAETLSENRIALGLNGLFWAKRIHLQELLKMHILLCMIKLSD